MPKELKVWNGRGYCCRKISDPRWEGIDCVHANVCAYSRADARRVLAEYCGVLPSDAELRNYFSPCWGNSMQGITPERGLWIEFERGKPVKVA